MSIKFLNDNLLNIYHSNQKLKLYNKTAQKILLKHIYPIIYQVLLKQIKQVNIF